MSLLRPLARPVCGDALLWRVRFNRDEQCWRPEARPPVDRLHGRGRAHYPLDVPSDGTWIAVTSETMVLALLNEYAGLRGGSPGPRQSRGLIIPQLLDAERMDVVVERAVGLRADRYPPFRLVAIDAHAVQEVVSDGVTIVRTGPEVTDCWMRTSSSVRPDEVTASRVAAFERVVTRRSVEAQDQFHEHMYPERPEEGVRMVRSDARTVSITTVDVRIDGVRMTYRPLAPDAGMLAPS